MKKILSLIMFFIFILTGCGKVQSNADELEGEEQVKVPTIKLNSGYEMPVLGLGTWTHSDKVAADCVYYAIKVGYRLIDTARYYGNEVGVGEGVRRAINEGLVTRDEIFVTSKILPKSFEAALMDIDAANNDLGLEYIDLMLIHQQGANDKQTYKALEQAVRDGKVHAIGISNYYTQQDFDRITKGAEIMPAVIQNENHIFYQNTALQKYVSQYGTVIESYYPLGGRGNTNDLLNNERIINIAKAHNKTPAQIILRWHIQAGYITIPGSTNHKHITENINIFDFELNADEMNIIAKMNTNRRYENW